MKKTRKQNLVKNAFMLFALFFASTSMTFSQIKISGTVTDSNKEPLIGVNITVSGSKTGTITDFNGKYTIQAPNNKVTIVFSYIGYKTIIKEVETSSVINVTLIEDAQEMEDVVVVAYGTQKKSHLTGAVSSLKTEKMDEVPVSRVDQALQGKLAGVQINNNNPEAGEKPQIRVRGMGSISANNDPLVVVDGFPVPDGLSMVSMGDIESIEVLKDAASAALYGSRAAGGVILVTTKNGNIKKPKYNFKMYNGVKTALKLPQMHTTQEYTELLFAEAELRKLDPAINGVSSETMAFNKIMDTERAAYLILQNLVDQPTDWLSEGLREFGTMQNYQLNASGGDKNLKYFVSGNYTGEEGIMKNSTYDKYTFRAKMDIKLSKSVTLGINLSPTFSRQERPAVDLTDYMRFPSWIPIRHNAATAALTGKTAGDYAQPSDFNGISISGIGYDNEVWHLSGVSPFSSSNQNPVSIRERTSIFTDEYKLQGNTYLAIDILKGLQFKTSNGVYFSYKEYNKKEQTSANKAGNPNSLTRQMTLRRELLSENTLTYDKKWGGHEIGILTGITFQKSNNNYNAIVGTGFPDEGMLSYNLASQIILDSPTLAGTTSYYYSESLMSLLGRINYAYQGKYMGSLSLRSDGSSKFAAGHKWGTFPAGSIGWRASEEKFLKQFDWLSNLKLRASYGLTGNNNIPQYSYMNSINTSNYVLGTGNGSLISGMASNTAALGNPDITWEQTAEANYGIDLGFFNSRLNISVEHYNSNTIQLLLQQPAMYITGHQTYWNNIGKVNNKGWEIEISTTNISKKDFTWKTSANLSTNKNTLLNYGDKEKEDNFGERNEVYRAVVGQPAIQYFGYKTDGVYTSFEEVAAAKALTDENGVLFTYTKYAPIVGGLKVVNTNKDNKIDADDRIVLGDPFPDFTWGITNSFTYKNFDLSFLFQGVQGVDLINGNVNYNEQLRLNKAYTANRYVSPMFPGDGKTVYSTTTAGSDLMLSDYAIEDGSYAALRDLTFGYKIPATLVNKIKLGDLRVYFSAQNLIYLMASDYRGINPEARKTTSQYTSPLVDGYQRGAFPLNRTFTLGVDITF
ncbi:MAG: TonB-dependent receptor [Bacteroidales bacterium]|nr:TonB-dependent receptor [Bacteroidales bacterium]